MNASCRTTFEETEIPELPMVYKRRCAAQLPETSNSSRSPTPNPVLLRHHPKFVTHLMFSKWSLCQSSKMNAVYRKIPQFAFLCKHCNVFVRKGSWMLSPAKDKAVEYEKQVAANKSTRSTFDETEIPELPMVYNRRCTAQLPEASNSSRSTIPDPVLHASSPEDPHASNVPEVVALPVQQNERRASENPTIRISWQTLQRLRANYDALLTLTNLASVSDSARKRIMKEKVVAKAEEFWFMTDHDHLRAAAAELLLNMLFLDEFYDETCAKGTDRVKLWALYCAEDDERLQLSASAAFSILTNNPEVCRRIIDEISSWVDLIKEICASEHPEIQKRCMIGVANMVASGEKVAAEMMRTDIFHVLIAVAKFAEKGREEAQKQAHRAIDAAVKFGVIAPTDREKFEQATNMSTIKE